MYMVSLTIKLRQGTSPLGTSILKYLIESSQDIRVDNLTAVFCYQH
jgi:hypothetical protein